MNPFKISNLALMMSAKVAYKDISKIVDKLEINHSGNLDVVSPDSVGIASLQLFCRRYESLQDYIVDMGIYVGDAVNRRAQMVVFPIYSGLLPFFFLSQADGVLEKLQPESETGLPDPKKLLESIAYFSDYIFEAYYNTMSLLAAAHGIYIMSGSTIFYEDGELRHRAFLFDDRGELAGYQDKVSLNGLEQALNVQEGSEIKLFDTPVGSVCILIGDDADYFETARIASGLGAKIILNPTAFAHEYTPVDSAAGLNLRVQENNMYGVQSVLVGESGLGKILEGPACIFAPNELVRSGNGILGQSSGRLCPDICYHRLDLDLLSGITNSYTHDYNRAFLDKYVDRLY